MDIVEIQSKEYVKENWRRSWISHENQEEKKSNFISEERHVIRDKGKSHLTDSNSQTSKTPHD